MAGEFITPEFPNVVKTQVITIKSRQRRMVDFYNLPGSIYMAFGKQTPWKSDTDSEVSDQNPPVPDPNQQYISELVGCWRIQWKMYAKPLINPTTAEKNDHVKPIYENEQIVGYTDGVEEYKGVWYKCTLDQDIALTDGYTCVMLYAYLDRDDVFPVGVTFRQTGVYVQCTQTQLYIPASTFNNLSPDDRGYLELICNWRPYMRSAETSEEFYTLFSF